MVRNLRCPHCEAVIIYPRDKDAEEKARKRREKRRNAALADVARNHRRQWTGPELEIASRPDLTIAQVAKMLGRTYEAVRHMRRLLEIDPRKEALAGIDDTAAQLGKRQLGPGFINERPAQ